MKVRDGMILPDKAVEEITTDRSVSLAAGSSAVIVITNKSALTVRLPIAADSADCFVLVLVKGIQPSGTIVVTIVDAGDTDMTAITLEAVGDYSCLYCDGLFWFPVSQFIAS